VRGGRRHVSWKKTEPLPWKRKGESVVTLGKRRGSAAESAREGAVEIKNQKGSGGRRKVLPAAAEEGGGELLKVPPQGGGRTVSIRGRYFALGKTRRDRPPAGDNGGRKEGRGVFGKGGSEVVAQGGKIDAMIPEGGKGRKDAREKRRPHSMVSTKKSGVDGT